MTTPHVVPEDASDVLTAALAAAQRGWPVFPVRGKAPAIPRGTSWQDLSTTDPGVIVSWFAGTSGLGVAVDLAKAGLCVIDVDHLEHLPVELEEALGARNTWTYRGNRGRLSFVFATRTVLQARHQWGDVKAGGGYVVLPPSPHPHGPEDSPVCDGGPECAYEWLDRPGPAPEHPGDEVKALVARRTPQEAPGTAWSGEPASQAQREHCEGLRDALVASLAARPANSGRNDELNRVALVLGHYVPHVLDEVGVVRALEEACVANGLARDDGPSACRATIRSGLKAGMADPQVPAVLEDVSALLDVPEGNAGPALPDGWDEAVGIVGWAALWAEEEPERDFLIPGVLTCGAAASLYSGPGVGKSLLALEWAACLATGQDILGEPVAPRTVLYIDHENDRILLRERLEAMGFGPSDDLGRLHYSLLGDWAPLDTRRGGDQVLAVARHLEADLVIVDTTARVIDGEENQADTFHALYRHTVRPLKAAGIGVLRLDHTGKDPERGERGSSAKRGDVDLAYSLVARDLGGVVLRREKDRLHLVGSEVLTLDRTEEPLRHTLADVDAAREGRVQAVCDHLDALGVWLGASRREARDALNAAGVKARNDVLGQAVARRRLRSELS